MEKTTLPKRPYCRDCGKAMEWPHDEARKGCFDITTGERKDSDSQVRTYSLAYCMRDDFYAIKDKDGKWIGKYDLMSVLHLIA